MKDLFFKDSSSILNFKDSSIFHQDIDRALSSRHHCDGKQR